jgi:hypothetical protein
VFRVVASEDRNRGGLFAKLPGQVPIEKRASKRET